ncbi:SDR family oxidoreductase [Allopusillimonas ginsengisoli]|uniref:SDR family oxidoreductase n=1 Tax=Allopusillimonas ginsengisoli TaxID=453575 RepID=UPI00101EE3AE|nr:SDR family oxidoreductase [Allopusillimonas ginsengisoli]TEA69500.1 SDR family oxidoreductase [Allopusillimonas ginsengisoli]
MNLDIAGRKAMVCGASQGIGRACAELLAKEGAKLVLVARNEAKLAATADAIRAEYGVDVDIVAADLARQEGRAHVLAYCNDPDILIHNGGWPETDGDFREWTHANWQQALDAMMLAPIELITGVVEGMASRKFGRIVAITSRFVKEPQLELSLSVCPRLGLTGFMSGLAREMAPHNVTLNTALPGIIATDTQYQYGRDLAAASGKSFEEIWKERSSTNAAKRFAEPSEFASLCAYLCSAQAGFITGQNILCDGGGYPGTF